MSRQATLSRWGQVLLVFLGGALGTGVRYGLGAWLDGAYRSTLLVNGIGAFLLGWLLGWVGHHAGPRATAWRLFVGTGLLGAFTTYSTFAVALTARPSDPVWMWVAALMLLPVGVLLALGGLKLGERRG